MNATDDGQMIDNGAEKYVTIGKITCAARSDFAL